MRQLRDREDVDEVEEQLDRGRLLRPADAARPQVTDRRRHRSLAGVGLAGVGDDPVRREIDQRPAGPAEAMPQQRHVVMVPAEMVDEQVRRRDDREEEPEDERDQRDGNDDDDGEDRQRRAHQEPEEHEGRDLDAAERAGSDLACDQGVLFEAVGGDVSGVGLVMASPSRSHGPARIRVSAASSP